MISKTTGKRIVLRQSLHCIQTSKSSPHGYCIPIKISHLNHGFQHILQGNNANNLVQCIAVLLDAYNVIVVLTLHSADNAYSTCYVIWEHFIKGQISILQGDVF